MRTKIHIENKADRSVALLRLNCKVFNVEPRQLTVDRFGLVRFKRLNQAERWANSRGNSIVRHRNGDFRKWCEQCGKQFETFNEDRHLCNECHHEICDILGTCYARPLLSGGYDGLTM